MSSQLGFRKLPGIFPFNANLAIGTNDNNNYHNISQFEATLISQHLKCVGCKAETDTQQQKFR